MKPVYLKFPSGRSFLAVKDIEKARNNKRVFFFIFNEEFYKKNFDMDLHSVKADCQCLYASPTKIGIKNITKKDGDYYTILCQSEKIIQFFQREVFPQLEDDFSKDYLIFSEEPHGKNPYIEVSIQFPSQFQVYALDRMLPVSYSPFTYSDMAFNEGSDRQILSLGNETDFTIAYLQGTLATVSPNFGALESLYEIDAMDIFVNTIMGHSQFKDISIVKDHNKYSMISDYTRRFPKVHNVSHVFSHLANVMYDNGFRKEKGIGIVYDSVSYDEGDQILGGEIIYGNIGNFQIVGGWMPIPLPGGDIANIEPWRIALAIIREIVKGDVSNIALPLIENTKENPDYSYLFKAINEKNLDYSLSSSMHHIIAALGEMLSFEATTYDFDYFENLMDKYFIDKYASDGYWIPIIDDEEKCLIDTFDLFKKIMSDLLARMDLDHMVYKSIASIASATAEIAAKISKKYNEKKIFLSGEFFKHPHFLTMIHNELTKRGLEVYIHKNIPVDDSGVSVGQMIYHYFETQGTH